MILVQLDIFRIINWVIFKRINRYKDGSHIGIDVSSLKSGSEVLQQSLFREVWKLTQVGIIFIFRLV